MARSLTVEGLAASDVDWTATGGQLTPTGATARFIAPAAAGTYRVTASSRTSPSRSASATLVVRGVDSTALVRNDVNGAVAGHRGSVTFESKPEGAAGARARFVLSPDNSGGLSGGAVVDVDIVNETHGIITFEGRTLDGDGALTAEEQQTLEAIVDRGLFPALALIPLDLACSGQMVQGETTHTYAIPSDMRYASGAYTATIRRVGQDISATTQVQARWSFDATPIAGDAPLDTAFTWNGFAFVGRQLSCTLDFGGSAPEVLNNCANLPASFTPTKSRASIRRS